MQEKDLKYYLKTGLFNSVKRREKRRKERKLLLGVINDRHNMAREAVADRALIFGSGGTGSISTAVNMSLCPWASPQIAPVRIVHSIECM